MAEAQIWYEEQQIGLAAEFLQELSAVFVKLTESPLIYPVVYQDIRRVVLHRFPFLIWYRVEGETVTVLACTHGKADPDSIRSRLS
jgi:plasmid stabilization system protein ParE